MTASADRPYTIEIAIPYLRTKEAAKAIAFYIEVFGAVEVMRLTDPNDGRIGHAELSIGNTRVMLSDEYPEMGILSPSSIGGTGSCLHLHMTGVDELYKRALAAGAISQMEPTDQFYGERVAKFVDPFGHEWMLGEQIEEVSPSEMQQRYNELMKG